MKIYYLAVLIFFLSSCTIQRPVETSYSKNNVDYKVSYLFEHDGCKVYRFRDGGDYVYFTSCSGNVTAIKNDSIKTRIETIVTRE